MAWPGNRDSFEEEGATYRESPSPGGREAVSEQHEGVPAEEYGRWTLFPWEDASGYGTRVAGDPPDRAVEVVESEYADRLVSVVDRLTRENEELREAAQNDDVDFMRRAAEDVEARYFKAEERADRAERALREYGRHKVSCRGWALDGAAKCECGFVDALAELEGRAPAGTGEETVGERPSSGSARAGTAAESANPGAPQWPEHEDRPVTIPELTHALSLCLRIFEERGEGSTLFTLPLKGLIERARKQEPPCEVCGGHGNDPSSSSWLHPDPCLACGGSGRAPGREATGTDHARANPEDEVASRRAEQGEERG